MRESRKERGELKASHHFIDERKDVSITVFAWAYIFPQNNTNYQNQHKKLTMTRTKWEEIKREKKINKSNGQREGTINRVNSGRSCEIFQVVKISEPCQISCKLQFPCIFCFSFLLVYDL